MNIDQNGLFTIRSAVAVENVPKGAPEPEDAEANAASPAEADA